MKILAIVLNLLITCLLVLVILGANRGALLFLPVFLLPVIALLQDTKRWFAYVGFGLNLLATAVITISFGLWAGAGLSSSLPTGTANVVVTVVSVLLIVSVPALNMLSLSAKYHLFRKAPMATAP